MGEILFLAHRVPFPPDRGDKIRSHHLLKALAALAPIHVGTFGENAHDMAQRDELCRIAKTHLLTERKRPLALAGAQALLSRKPVSLTAFDQAEMRRFIAKTLKNHPIDTIFVFSGQMGQFVPDDFSGRVITDLCDVDSAKFEAYAAAGRRPWLNRREADLLRIEEARLARRSDTTLLISKNEADLLRIRMVDTSETDIRALGNGIDADFFDPGKVGSQPDLDEGDDPQIVFTGQMDYAPNVEAVQWAIANIMPPLRKLYPRARLHIVGRAPTTSLRSMHGENGVRIWGEVPDVRPYLKSADLVLVPLLIARGVQNKVLEAMAMSRPVVLTSEAATGIEAKDGEHFSVSSAVPELMVSKVDSLLRNPGHARAMGTAARKFVIESKGWSAVLEPLAKIVGRDNGSRDAA